ncbi:auxin efflux carrier [Nadsonia fulvescens var. elongata DSM 6958]|uniref:Auxin efflux carrier n=1 Tax=Nadsonia fulvescens var. elongata DSM 6958 TaxID=857566 RepID=A0A1E3PHS9_9ASCO|nr:auxin efflux carrier [Nadsonia fulvescens var. elongata DSM 6958]
MAEPLSIGAAIYISIKPMIKIFLNAGIGFYLARQNIFTIEFCQKMSVAIVNVLSPCLVFSRIVSTIDVGQMRTIGVIVLIGFVYQLLGLVVGMVLNRTTPVPKNWRGGMLIAGMLNNAGDLPVAYVTTLAQGSLFSANDGARGTSYAIAFMFCFTICLFNFGGYRLIENDFKDRLCVPQDEESQTEGDGTSNDTPEKHTEKSDDKISQLSLNEEVLGNSTSASLNMVTSSKSSAKDTGFKGRTLNYIRSIKDNSKSSKEILAILRGYLWQLGVNFLRPPSLALIIAVVITIIKPVRRLFYDDHSTSSIPNAPDGLPVLSFVMDLTNFIGNAAVPCGLCMLGATLSRLKITALPKGFWKSLFAMSLFKLVILPIIGILIVTRMMTIGWISKDNYMAIFVIIVSAGTPGSTSQIYITALYTPPGDNHDELDWVSAMLILQYCVLIFTLTVVVTYTLKNIVGF